MNGSGFSQKLKAKSVHPWFFEELEIRQSFFLEWLSKSLSTQKCTSDKRQNHPDSSTPSEQRVHFFAGNKCLFSKT